MQYGKDIQFVLMAIAMTFGIQGGDMVFERIIATVEIPAGVATEVVVRNLEWTRGVCLVAGAAAGFLFYFAAIKGIGILSDKIKKNKKNKE